jgi:hypothetical protein
MLEGEFIQNFRAAITLPLFKKITLQKAFSF